MMTYYGNKVFPVGLVVSDDIENIKEEYDDASGRGFRKGENAVSVTYPMTRKGSGYCAVGVVLYVKDIPVKIVAHEAFHAASFILSSIDVPLNDSTEEVYAYLVGWAAEQIDSFLRERNEV